jgi:hypothetical protein
VRVRSASIDPKSKRYRCCLSNLPPRISIGAASGAEKPHILRKATPAPFGLNYQIGREMLFRGSVINTYGEKVSPYLLFRPRTLREVCRSRGSDDNGRSCPSCSLREFCETQAARSAGDDYPNEPLP